MTEEPARKKHWDDLLPVPVSQEDLDRLRKKLDEALKAQERVEGIVLMCYLDNALEQLLRSVMIHDKSVDQVMKDDRLLGSFSNKMKLAYALGLIPEPVRKDLDCLNKIRNAFAHEADVTSFDAASIRARCENLSTAKRMDGRPRPPDFAHQVAVVDNLFFLESEIDRRAEEKRLRQNQPEDTVESRYAAFRVGHDALARQLDDDVAPEETPSSPQ